jgi:hypothetical protein
MYRRRRHRATIKESVRRLVSDAVRKTEFARDWRDRRIAHRDLELALREGANPVAGRAVRR